MNLKIVSLSTSIFALALASNLDARWATKDDASVEVLKNETKLKIKKDGTSVIVVDQKLKILNEEARQNYASELIMFDKSREDVKVLEAETLVGDKKYVVPVDRIEVKPLASDARALRKDYQMMVPFQNVVIGSVIHLKYERNKFEADMPDYFAAAFTYDSGDSVRHWTHSDITIESELPFETKVNDPTQSLEVTKGKNSLHVKLKKPYVRGLIGEPYSNYIEPKNQTSFSISTEKDFNKIGAYFGKFYEDILNQPLPPKLDELRKKAESQKSEVEQINTVTEGIIDAIHYLGSWDTAAGHLIPRPLQTISDTGYGDCKEYSVCLAAILRKLGFETHAVEVDRSHHHIDTEELPSLSHANHIIVKAVGKSGQVYWVDPTNITTMAGGIFHDISNRPALILDPKKPSLEAVPEIDFRKAAHENKETITIGKDNTILRKGSVHFKGERAEPFTRNMFSSPASVTEDYIIKTLCDGREPLSKKVTLPKVTSRKVQDYGVEYEITEGNTLLHTNQGYGFSLDGGWPNAYLETSESHEGAVLMDIPGTYVKELHFKGLKADNLDSLNYSVKSPWLNAERAVKATPDGIVLNEKVEILQSKITPEEIRSPEFKNLRETLQKQCKGVAIILSK